MEKQLFVWSSAYSAKSALRFHPQLPRAAATNAGLS